MFKLFRQLLNIICTFAAVSDNFYTTNRVLHKQTKQNAAPSLKIYIYDRLQGEATNLRLRPDWEKWSKLQAGTEVAYNLEDQLKFNFPRNFDKIIYCTSE